jgi:hypothetical protein
MMMLVISVYKMYKMATGDSQDSQDSQDELIPKVMIIGGNNEQRALYGIVKMVNDDIGIICGDRIKVIFHKDTPVRYIIDYLLWRCSAESDTKLSVVSNFEMGIPHFTKECAVEMEKIIMFLKYCTKYLIDD